MAHDDAPDDDVPGAEHPPPELLDLFVQLDAFGVTPEQFARDMGVDLED